MMGERGGGGEREKERKRETERDREKKDRHRADVSPLSVLFSLHPVEVLPLCECLLQIKERSDQR